MKSSVYLRAKVAERKTDLGEAYAEIKGKPELIYKLDMMPLFFHMPDHLITLNTMPKFEILGNFQGASTEVLGTALRQLSNQGELQVNSKLLTDLIRLDADGLQFVASTYPDDPQRWTLNGTFEGPHPDMDKMMEQLVHSLTQAGIIYALDYTEVDDQGEPVAEEVSIFHPHFGEG